ncbi:radical SAM protein [Candidatus Bipolaricaulota bacterium]
MNPYEAHVRYRLPPAVAFVVALFDGVRTIGQIASNVARVFACEREIAVQKVADVIERVSGTLLIPVGRASSRWSRFCTPIADVADLLYAPSDLPTPRARLPYNLAYVASRRCVRNCVYCYANAGTRIPLERDRMPLPRMRALIEEAGQLGVSLISFSGGEPLMCPETIELMLQALDEGVFPWVSTKALLTLSDAHKLGSARLPIIQVSIDSIDEGVQDWLCGIPGTLQDLKATILNAVDAGIGVYTNSVVTSANAAGIPELVNWLLGNGVTSCLLTPYTHSLGRHSDALFPSRSDWQFLKSWEESIDPTEVQLRFTKGIAEEDASEEARDTAESNERPRSKCTAGREGFSFSWSGIATPCERLASSGVEPAIVGNLKQQSIEEVWNSPELHRLTLPRRSDCVGTVCESCVEFDDCLAERGRCMVRSWLAYDQLLGPDPLCKYAPPSNVRIF